MSSYDLEYDVTPNGNCRNANPVQMFHVKIKKTGEMTYINMVTWIIKRTTPYS